MKMMALTVACVSVCAGVLVGVAADEPMFHQLPESPAALIEALKAAGDRYTVRGPVVDYVKESDLPYLVGLLDSEEPCALVDLAESSIYYPGRSTVGREAAYLIEGFWKREYPTELTSQQYEPNVAEMKLWYAGWSHRKKLAAAEGDVARERAEYHLVQAQVADEVPSQGPVEAATVYVLVCPDARVYVFRAFHGSAMKALLQTFPAGGVLHYDGNALAAQPTPEQVAALANFCAAHGLEFVLSPTN